MTKRELKYGGQFFVARILGLMLVLGLTFGLSHNDAFAAAFNDAADGDWALGATWGNGGNNVAGSGYPSTSDTATIDSNTVTTSTTTNVTTVNVNTGGTLTLDSSAFNAASTTIAGGTLNASSSLMTITTGWAFTSGTFNAQTGTVRFRGNTAMVGNTTFFNLTYDSNSASTRTLTLTGYNATTTGTFTYDNGNASNAAMSMTGGTISALGDVAWEAAPAQSASNSTVLHMRGTGDQLIANTGTTTTAGGFMPTVVNKASGTLYLSGVFRTLYNWNNTQGTVNATQYNSSIRFAQAATVTGPVTFNHLMFNTGGTNSTFTLAGGTTTAAGTFTYDSSGGSMKIDGVDLQAMGSSTIDFADLQSGSARIVFGGSADQIVTALNGTSSSNAFTTLVNKSGGTLTFDGTYRVTSYNQVAGNVDWTTYGSTLAIMSGNFVPGAVTYNNLLINTTTLLGDLTLAGNFTNGTSFTSGSNTVTFTGASTSTISMGGTDATHDLQNLTINKSTGVPVELSGPLDVDGTLTITSGALDLKGYNLSTTATCNVTGAFRLLGDETVSCTPTFNTGSFATYNATSGTRAIKNWTYRNIFVNGTGGTFTDATSRTLGEALNVRAGTFAPTATLTITGTTTVSGGVLSATSSVLDLNGNVSITSGTFVAPTSTMTIAGDWSKTGGTFTHSSGTATFDGADQSITGSNTWNAFSKIVATARTLTFASSSTQTILGTLTLQGASGQLLSLRSSTNGVQWNIDPQGTRTLSYLDVRDSNNINGSVINTAGLNVTDSGNNTGWVAGSGPSVSVTSPADGTTVRGTAVSLTASASDDVGVVGVQFKVDTTTNIGAEDTGAPFTASWNSTGVADGTHTLIAVARDADGNYATSTAINVTVDNTAPIISSVASSTSATTATITWSTNENSTSTVEYGLTTGYGSASTSASSVTSHSITLTGLTSDTLYHFRVSSSDAVGNVATSSDLTFRTSDAAAPIISSVASSTTATTATITWTTDEVSTSTVRYGLTTGYGSASTSAALVTSHSITLTGLTSNTLYHFQVGSSDASGNVATSSDLTFMTPDVTAPIISSVATSTSATSATITWSTNENSTSTVEYGLTSGYGSASTSAASVTSHSIVLTGLTSDTLYHFRVSSADASGNVATSSDLMFRTPDVTAPIISSVASSTGATTATITWTTDENSTSTVRYGLTASYGSASTSAASVTSHSISLTGLTSNTLYHFQVASADASGNEATSSDLTFRTPDVTAPIISSIASSTADISATITWTTDENSTSTVEYGLTTGYGSASTSVALVTSHSITLTGLTADTLYHFRVSSADSSNNRATSTDRTFMTAAAPDTTGPVISSIASSTSLTTGTVTWTTDEASDSVLQYGLSSGSYTFSTSSASLVTSHSLTATGLTPGTRYYFVVSSTDFSSNASTSAERYFTTAPDVTAPAISLVASSTSSTGATITWDTNEAADSQVEYGLTASYGSLTTLDSSLVTSHSVSISGLSASTTYHFRVRSSDAASNLASSSDQTFMTTEAAATPEPEDDSSSGGGSQSGSGNRSRRSGGGGGTAPSTVVASNGVVVSTPATIPTLQGFIEVLISVGVIPADKVEEAREAVLRVSSVSSAAFPRYLQLHDSGDDVKTLQGFLIGQGYLSVGEDVGIFGLKTYTALKQYQAAVGIPATGYFGPQTRAWIAQ